MGHEVAEANALVIEHARGQFRAYFRDLPLLSGYGSTAAAAERALLDAYRAAWWERTRAHTQAEQELGRQRSDLDALRAAVARLAYARLLSDGTAERAEALAARCDAQAAALRMLVAAWRQERQAAAQAQAQGWLWSDTETENHE